MTGGQLEALLSPADPNGAATGKAEFNSGYGQLEVKIEGAGLPRDVLQREINGRPAYTAVFDKVSAGSYTLWVNDEPRARDVAVTGGAIAELDWR